MQWWIKSAGKSIFNWNREYIEDLVRKSESIVPTLQGNWNYQRIVVALDDIWVDRVTWLQTKVYTVITRETWELVTAFPGNP